MREQIRAELTAICPFDGLEREQVESALAWVDSGVGLCWVEKPAVPRKHLVSYFVVVDGDWILLVDHKNARLWLPTGGHVEPGERVGAGAATHPLHLTRASLIAPAGLARDEIPFEGSDPHMERFVDKLFT